MLSTPVRLHLMWLLCHGEHDVGWLAGRVGTSVAAVSQQLGKLRLAGLVSARREGRYQIYTADDPHILMLVDQVFEHLAPEPPPGADDRTWHPGCGGPASGSAGSAAIRSAAGTWGTGIVSIARMSTCSCRTWLCSTFARSASGAVSLPRLRKTAVPGTRCNGGFMAWR